MCASVANLTRLAEGFTTLTVQPTANEMDGRSGRPRPTTLLGKHNTATGMITSFIIRYLSWQAHERFWGRWADKAGFSPTEAAALVNTCRLLGSYRVSVSALAKMHSHRDPPISGGLKPGARGHLRGPRQCLGVDILSDLRQFAISNGNVEDPVVFKRLIRGFDSPRSEADDQNPVSLRYELGGLWVRSFHRFVSFLK